MTEIKKRSKFGHCGQWPEQLPLCTWNPEMETFVLAMNNKRSCEGDWWWVVYKPSKHKPVVGCVRSAAFGNDAFQLSPHVRLRTLMRRSGSWSTVVEAAARSFGQNMFSACHSYDLSRFWCRVNWVLHGLVVTGHSWPHSKCWAWDSQRTVQIPSWSCNHTPAAHSLADNSWIMKA